jgi:hypothetical protein
MAGKKAGPKKFSRKKTNSWENWLVKTVTGGKGVVEHNRDYWDKKQKDREEMIERMDRAKTLQEEREWIKSQGADWAGKDGGAVPSSYYKGMY